MKFLSDLPKPPPYNEDAERAVLAAALADGAMLSKLRGIVGDDYFYDPTYRAIWKVITEMADAGEVATVNTIHPYLAKEDRSGVVPADVLRSLGDPLSRDETMTLAMQVRNLYFRREVMGAALAVQVIAENAGPSMTAEKLFDDLDGIFSSIRPPALGQSTYETFGQSSHRALQTASQVHRDAYMQRPQPGITTGLQKLDEAIGRLQAPDLIVIGGRPGMGKTALATNIAVSAAESLSPSQGVVVFVSMEMSSEQLSSRVICQKAEVPSWVVRKGRMTDQQAEKLAAAEHSVRNLPLDIDQTTDLTISTLRSRMRALKRERGVALIVVDYIQLLKKTSDRQNDYSRVTEAVGGLKAMAKELNVPVIALSQLSRNIEMRSPQERRPNMGDLRESGAIEQDADIILLMYREHYYLTKIARRPAEGSQAHFKWEEEKSKWEGVAEVHIAKNRHGPDATIRLGFKADLTRFDNEPPTPESPPEEVKERVVNNGLSNNEKRAVNKLKAEMAVSGTSLTLDRIGVVEAVPYAQWADLTTGDLLDPDRPPKERRGFMERLNASLLEKNIIGRATQDGQAYVWLTMEAQRV